MEIINNKMQSGFKAPEGYFDNFEENLFDPQKKSELPKLNHGFVVPDNYFESFENNLFQKIENNNNNKVQDFIDKPVISLKSRRIIITAIAAVLLLFITSPFIINSQKEEVLNIETSYFSLNEDEITDVELVAFLDESQITELETELLNDRSN